MWNNFLFVSFKFYFLLKNILHMSFSFTHKMMEMIWNKMINLSIFLARLQIQTYLKYFIYLCLVVIVLRSFTHSASSSNSAWKWSKNRCRDVVCIFMREIFSLSIFFQHLGSFVKCQFISTTLLDTLHVDVNSTDTEILFMSTHVLLSTKMTFSSTFFSFATIFDMLSNYKHSQVVEFWAW